jgi:hypothetical protein
MSDLSAVSGLTPLQQRQRLGCLTASIMGDARAMLKSGKGETAIRRQRRVEKVTERLTGVETSRFVTYAMQRGIDWEESAKEALQLATGVLLGSPEFVLHRHIPWFGATPDSVTGDLLHEFKVPLPHNYVEYLEGGEIPAEHLDQLIAQQCVTGIRATVFAAYCPEMPERLRLFVREFRASDEQIEQCEADARQFLDEVEQMYQRLMQAAA